MKLIMLPIPGASADFLAPQTADLPFVEIPNWLVPHAKEDIPTYARRWALDLGGGPGVFIGGVSISAPLALELAQHLPVAGVFLISGLKDALWLNPKFQKQEMLIRRLPDFVLRTMIRRMATPYLTQEEGLGSEMSGRLVHALENLDVSFLRWLAQAAVNWSPSWTFENQGFKVYQIFGAEDQLLSSGRGSDAVFVPGGRHLIHWTHAKQVNDFIREKMGVLR